MKKDYLKPEMEVMAFASEMCMQTTSTGGNQQPVIPGEGEEGDFANDRRGGWGNLWE